MVAETTTAETPMPEPVPEDKGHTWSNLTVHVAIPVLTCGLCPVEAEVTPTQLYWLADQKRWAVGNHDYPKGWERIWFNVRKQWVVVCPNCLAPST